jgi:hypothetical protein
LRLKYLAPEDAIPKFYSSRGQAPARREINVPNRQTSRGPRKRPPLCFEQAEDVKRLKESRAAPQASLQEPEMACNLLAGRRIREELAETVRR